MQLRIQTFAATMAISVLAGGHLMAKTQEVAEFESEIEPLLSRFCFDCHSDGENRGGLDFDAYENLESHLSDAGFWEPIWQNLRAQLMPPPEKRQPSEKQRQQLIEWIESRIFRLDPKNPDPGRVTIRRLNRREYQNTIRDLFGVEFEAEIEFPPDDTGFGFDNIGDVLSISPLLMEKYVAAAETIVAQALPKLNSDPKVTIREYAPRIFRRPVPEAKLTRYLQLGETSLEDAMVAMLVSPQFLYRAEIQPEPNNSAKIVPIDEFALASRLSYFLWSSPPDEELSQLAERGELRANLPAQVQRLIQDPKSQNFVEDFTGQWLQTNNLHLHQPTIRIIVPTIKKLEVAQALFNDKTREAMRLETEHFFAHVLRQNRPVLDFLRADYTFLNEPLAFLYSINGIKGEEMRQVELKRHQHRGGILNQGTFLFVTSNPTRTSPVKRGLFVLENLLGTPAPPAPPDVPELSEPKHGGETQTMREAMEIHREQKICASCHARMDPIGLALENFNALGMWREKENGRKIDASGQLITGERFKNAEDLIEVLSNDRRQDFYRCLTEKLLTYAIGRGIHYRDAPTIDAIVEQLGDDNGFQTLIQAIVQSAPFQLRRGDGQFKE